MGKGGVGRETRNMLVSSKSLLVFKVETDYAVYCSLPVVFLGQRISFKSYGSAPIKAGIT